MTSDDDLDKLTADYVEHMAQILELSKLLEQIIGNGRLNLSKARYCMGGHDRVSALYYNKADLAEPSQMQVELEEDTLPGSEGGGDGLTYHQFSIVDTTVTSTDKSMSSEPLSLTKGNSETQSVSTGTDQQEKNVEGSTKKSRTNVLNWFGILVPQSLRSAQQDFKRCLPLVCELASKKAKLAVLRSHIQNSVDTRLADDMSLKTSLIFDN